MGANMILRVQINPTNVSFADIVVREKGGIGTQEGAPHGVTGYFGYVLSIDGPNGLDHDPVNPGSLNTKAWNHPDEVLNEYPDQAAGGYPRWPPPIPYVWSGSFHWEIPYFWDVNEAENGDEFDNVHQLFDLSADGTMTITKRQANITRGINETHGH